AVLLPWSKFFCSHCARQACRTRPYLLHGTLRRPCKSFLLLRHTADPLHAGNKCAIAGWSRLRSFRCWPSRFHPRAASKLVNRLSLAANSANPLQPQPGARRAIQTGRAGQLLSCLCLPMASLPLPESELPVSSESLALRLLVSGRPAWLRPYAKSLARRASAVEEPVPLVLQRGLQQALWRAW